MELDQQMETLDRIRVRVKCWVPTSLSPSVNAIKVLLDDQRRIKAGGRFPGVVFGGISLPFDKVFALSDWASMIHNLVYFI